MKKITIYGERCSGTNYLEELLLLNFEVEIIWDYGWKHFFGFNDLNNSDDVLFIGIIRNIYDWINSFFREKHHLPYALTVNEDIFLTDTFYSIYKNNELIYDDLNMETKEKYKDIFELRCVKNKYLIKKMPTLVKNYCLITYDDLINNFLNIMNKLNSYNLEIKSNIEFPLNISYYKKEKNKPFNKKKNSISNKKIYKIIIKNEELMSYEKLLFPEIMNYNNKIEN
jgi:hypothetical protein